MSNYHRHILEDSLTREVLNLPPAEYYVARRVRAKLPAHGYVLFSREPESEIFKVHWAGGQSITRFGSAPGIVEELVSFGLDKEKVERALNHIWNFQNAYVKLIDGAPDSPPVRIPKGPIRTGSV